MSEKDKSKENVVRIGNYLLSYKDEGAVLSVRSVSGSWRIEWGFDSYMYSVLTKFLSDRKTDNYVDALLTLYYACTNYPHDLVSIVTRQSTPFMDGFARMVKEQNDYEVSVAQKHTGEEDEEALAEVVRMHELEEELDALDAKEALEESHTEQGERQEQEGQQEQG